MKYEPIIIISGRELNQDESFLWIAVEGVYDARLPLLVAAIAVGEIRSPVRTSAALSGSTQIGVNKIRENVMKMKESGLFNVKIHEREDLRKGELHLKIELLE